jgi:hypothetical protein
MTIGFELAWIENCTRWKAVATVSDAFFTRAFSNAAGVENEPKSLKVDSLTALAFIVYLLLPEFWVGWKPA